MIANMQTLIGDPVVDSEEIMTSGTTPVPIQREPELLGQTVVVIGRGAGRRINGGTAPRLRGMLPTVVCGAPPEPVDE